MITRLWKGIFMAKYPLINYNSYLKIDQLLSLQTLKSEEYKKPAHDEHLFIIIHQVYELWFKQILFEVESLRRLFNSPHVDESYMGQALGRMDRVREILRLLKDQVTILETMTPLDFLDFRDMLYPASGFQSMQFRLLENKLGLKVEGRERYHDSRYTDALQAHEQSSVKATEEEPSLFELIEKWLERTPFLQLGDYSFWESYRTAVLELFERDKEVVMMNPVLSEADRQRNLKNIEDTVQVFQSLFDEKKFIELQSQRYFRFSFKAIQAALFINLYRDEPILQGPFRLLTGLLDLDELMTTWRYRHAQMVQRMIGRKIGTGGSSGHDYLRKTADTHKIFSDFSTLATFLIPRSELPPLTPKMKEALGFMYKS